MEREKSIESHFQLSILSIGGAAIHYHTQTVPDNFNPKQREPKPLSRYKTSDKRNRKINEVAKLGWKSFYVEGENRRIISILAKKKTREL